MKHETFTKRRGNCLYSGVITYIEGKKVTIVELKKIFNVFSPLSNFKSFAVCNPEDEYDKKFGIRLAVDRCENKTRKYLENLYKKQTGSAVNTIMCERS